MTEETRGDEKKLLETTCDLERVALVFNPASGTENCAARRSNLERLARAAGLKCELIETDRDSGAAPLARNAVKDRMERVIVSGGDGSVTEAAGILSGTDVTLAVLPGGTGNLLALNLGIPSDCEQAMEIALRSQPLKLDVGRANGKVFLIMAGIGADGRVIRDADRESKRRLGVLAYFIAAVHHLRRPRIPYVITIDGHTIQRRALTVMVANLGRITGGLELVPGCNPYDGLLEVAIVRARGIRDIAALALEVLSGRPRSRSLLELHRGQRISIRTPLPQPVELDGNEAGVTDHLQVEVQPGALQLVAPAMTCESPAPAATLLERPRPAAAAISDVAGTAAGWLAFRNLAPQQSRAAWACHFGASVLVGMTCSTLITGALRHRRTAPCGSPAELQRG